MEYPGPGPCRSPASDGETGNTRERQNFFFKKKVKVSSSYCIYVAYMQCGGEIVSCKLKSNKNLTRVKSKKEMTLSLTRVKHRNRNYCVYTFCLYNNVAPVTCDVR